MDTLITVKADAYLKLQPSDFANRTVLRGVLGDEALTLYATLRVFGFDPLSSFAACFEEAVTCRLEAATEAAASLESTVLFTSLTAEVEDTLGEERVQAELAARLAEAAGFTRDAAMSARCEFRFKSRALSRHEERDAAEFSEFRSRSVHLSRNANESTEEYSRARREARDRRAY